MRSQPAYLFFFLKWRILLAEVSRILFLHRAGCSDSSNPGYMLSALTLADIREAHPGQAVKQDATQLVASRRHFHESANVKRKQCSTSAQNETCLGAFLIIIFLNTPEQQPKCRWRIEELFLLKALNKTLNMRTGTSSVEMLCGTPILRGSPTSYLAGLHL